MKVVSPAMSRRTRTTSSIIATQIRNWERPWLEGWKMRVVFLYDLEVDGVVEDHRLTTNVGRDGDVSGPG